MGRQDLRQKAAAVGLQQPYLAVFGGMSHNVHGSWHDLYQFHLESDEAGAFTPNFEWGRPRPQPLFALGHLALSAVAEFLIFIGGEAAFDQLRQQLGDLGARIESRWTKRTRATCRARLGPRSNALLQKNLFLHPLDTNTPTH